MIYTDNSKQISGDIPQKEYSMYRSVFR